MENMRFLENIGSLFDKREDLPEKQSFDI